MASITIRTMLEQDIPAVASLCGELVGSPCSPEQVTQYFRALSTATDHAAWVAERAGEVVGWAQVHGGHQLHKGSYAEVSGIVVSSQHQGQGIGRQLLAACEHWGAQKGYARLRLYSRQHRVEAHAFYRKQGYQHEKTSLAFTLDLPRASAS